MTNGTARLDDGTLSGTTLSLLQGVQNLVNWGLSSIETGIALGTTAPRLAIGQPTDIIGQPRQHLLRWSTDGERLQDWSRLTSTV